VNNSPSSRHILTFHVFFFDSYFGKQWKDSSFSLDDFEWQRGTQQWLTMADPFHLSSHFKMADTDLQWPVPARHERGLLGPWKRSIGAMKRVPHLMPRQTLHQMYDALVEPYLEYCCEVWGCMGLCQCDRLQKLQNRVARVITSCEDYRTRSANISQDLGWVTLENRQSKLLAVSVYKCINGFYPEGISAMFDSTASVHSHNLRGSSNNIFITRPHTEAGKQAFSIVE